MWEDAQQSTGHAQYAVWVRDRQGAQQSTEHAQYAVLVRDRQGRADSAGVAGMYV